jgi:DHA2 family multidrug resistance protein-like MFS transporter
MVPIDLMASPTFSLTLASSVASFAAQALAFVALPFLFQQSLHRSQVETGILMTPWPLAVGLSAPLSGHLADRYPAAVLSGLGLIVLALGLALLALLSPQATGRCCRRRRWSAAAPPPGCWPQRAFRVKPSAPR